MILGFSASSYAELLSVPDLNSRVTDLTKSLKANEITAIEASLAKVEALKGSQVAVLMVNTTQPEAIEGYSLRVVEKWKLGREGVDDGVLLLIALKDKKMRIEVGYGLEGAIPDIAAGRIISEFIAPEFRKGNIVSGVEAGITQITNLINGEPLPESFSSKVNIDESTFEKFIFFVVGSMIFGPFLRSTLGPIVGVLLVSSLAAGFIWFLTKSLSLALIAAFFLGMFHAITAFSKSNSYNDGGGYGGGFGGGGSSSGGGFSGGGGGFGGGGASGGW